MEEWASGKIMAPEAQPHAQLYGDLSDIAFEDIAEFYDLKIEDDNEHDEKGD